MWCFGNKTAKCKYEQFCTFLQHFQKSYMFSCNSEVQKYVQNTYLENFRSAQKSLYIYIGQFDLPVVIETVFINHCKAKQLFERLNYWEYSLNLALGNL